jgi:hypothetical protein
MSLSGINIDSARSRVANHGPNEKLAEGSDNVCSGSGLVNRTFWVAELLEFAGVRAEQGMMRAKRRRGVGTAVEIAL